MNTNGYALHETLDLHEIANFKAVCATKSKTMQALVTDPELKAILQQAARRPSSASRLVCLPMAAAACRQAQRSYSWRRYLLSFRNSFQKK
ncbi:MAG TPA: hypothetical protein VMS09_00575 [Paenibacillus sp.]|uniref:hypothetical protein n=1 Tax=Paenibacillus sp. TaxID=58172 RepID=UPI0028D39F52|nr:hypothetical protein [Paenibacillus sp.]HUC90502.1 hypothetical protein [Paenibacillus sp.]